MNNKIFIIVGPSGVGKGSITKALAANKSLNLEWARTATTRPRRPDDSALSQRQFFSEKEFKAMVKSGEILEHNFYNGHYYGALKSSVEGIINKKKNLLLEIDINGAMNLKKQFGTKVVLIYIYATKRELKKRLLERGMGAKVISQRMEIAERENGFRNKCDYTIHNQQNQLDAAVAEAEQIVSNETGE